MRYRYGIYAMIVLLLAAAPLLFDDLDQGLMIINLIIWPVAAVGALAIAFRSPRRRSQRTSRRRRIAPRSASSLEAPARYRHTDAETPALIEYRSGSV
jgi:hypothetical protein